MSINIRNIYGDDEMTDIKPYWKNLELEVQLKIDLLIQMYKIIFLFHIQYIFFLKYIIVPVVNLRL